MSWHVRRYRGFPSSTTNKGVRMQDGISQQSLPKGRNQFHPADFEFDVMTIGNPEEQALRFQANEFRANRLPRTGESVRKQIVVKKKATTSCLRHSKKFASGVFRFLFQRTSFDEYKEENQRQQMFMTFFK